MLIKWNKAKRSKANKCAISQEHSKVNATSGIADTCAKIIIVPAAAATNFIHTFLEHTCWFKQTAMIVTSSERFCKIGTLTAQHSALGKVEKLELIPLHWTSCLTEKGRTVHLEWKSMPKFISYTSESGVKKPDSKTGTS